MAFFSPEMFDNPYPAARSLRESDPVHWSAELDGWVLTRYADVAASLHDPRFAAARLPHPDNLPALGMQLLTPLFGTMRLMLTFLDPPDHGKLRRLATRGFTRPHVESWRPQIQQMVDDLLDRVEDAGGMDIVRDLARPLPLAGMSMLLGIPNDERLAAWSAAVGRFFGSFTHTRRQLLEVQSTILDFSGYLRDRIADLRAGRATGDDLLSGLVRDAGDTLGDDELVATAILLVGAGTVTTTDLIGNAVLSLLEHPDRLRELQASAATPGLLDGAMEELVRYDGPVQMTGRLLRDDVEMGGRRLRKGQWALLWLAAANRDPERFPDPDSIVFGRPDNRHLAFGSGAHFCLGAPLARLQGQIAIGTLLRRFPASHREDGPLVWERYPTLRGLTSLRVSF